MGWASKNLRKDALTVAAHAVPIEAANGHLMTAFYLYFLFGMYLNVVTHFVIYTVNNPIPYRASARLKVVSSLWTPDCWL
jgi:hypothetical protein